MCGIAGRVNQHAPVDRGELFRMTERIAHRGPDDAGYHLRTHVGLGHRRLSIVDLSGGHQPLANEDNTVWIVFNGEIYNHLELRKDLIARGHRFRTKSDTEAIVHAYEEWGADCATRLRGMFAFAIWDEGQQALTIVRDRLGIKPVYYAQLGSDLVFSSEIKSLLECPGLDARLDENALAAYLTLRYVPAPLTMFRGVKKLPPGNILRWHRGLTSIRRYWDVALLEQRDHVPPTELDAAFELRERIDHATRIRLMSEVPVGAFLSGGLDSTVITESMLRARDSRGALKTFSVGYEGADTASEDELDFARRAAQALGTEHREVRVSAREAADALPKIVWHLDEPVADAACVPLYFLSKRAKEEVTVVLSGEGADEILGGYHIYQRMLLADRLRQLGGSSVERAAQLATHLPSPRMRRLARILEQPLEQSYRGVARALDDSLRTRLCGGDPGDAADRLLAPHWTQSRGWSPLRRMLYLDQHAWLPDDLLVKADKMTMAHGIELRVPFLDHHLVEYAWSLPDRMKVRGTTGKALLRRAARGRVPAFVLDRVKKGFGTPAAAWLRAGMADLTRDALFSRSSLARDRFDLRYLERLVSRHTAGEDLSAELWPLVVLELWHSQLCAPANRAAETTEILPPSVVVAEENLYAAS
jgi:asparagine synthase (glutamine-hydrolysing)